MAEVAEVDPASLPMEPHADLDVLATVRAVCTGLQFNDTPHVDAGVERLYNFLTPAGRVEIAPPPPRSGLQGGVELEYFLENAASPAVGALLMCDGYRAVSDVTLSPGSQVRGLLATVMIEVRNEPPTDLPEAGTELDVLSRLVDAPDEHLQAVLDSFRRGAPPPPLPPRITIPPRTRFLLSLEQQRRPPLEGCWTFKELHNMARTKWQQLSELGEEFEGEDE